MKINMTPIALQMATLCTIGAVSTYAAPVCDTIDGCHKLIKTLQAKIDTLEPLHRLGPMAQGKTYLQAQKYCKSQGKRLPTLKELILAFNPKGLHELPVAGLKLKEYDILEDGVDFYYDESTYSRPEGEAGQTSYWTSSPTLGISTNRVYVFSGEDGSVFDLRINEVNYDITAAVRCIR